jgi:phage shock protein C
MVCVSCQKVIADGSNFCCICGAKQPEGAAAPVVPPIIQRKKLVRSLNDRKIAGVCAGIADYFDIDPTIVRVIWLLATLIPGPNIIAYIVLWIVLPEGYTGTVRTPATTTSA